MATKKTSKKKTSKKKTTKNGKPIGAPTRYKPEFCDMLIEHMSKGLSLECFGGDIDGGVPHGTILHWLKTQPAFSEAKRKGHVKYRKFWEDMGVRGAKGEIKNFNAVTWIFNMKNRFKWRNEVIVKDERALESVTIELPNAGQQQVIDLKEGSGYESSE